MSTSVSSSSSTFYSRKLLLHTTLYLSPDSPVSPHIVNGNGRVQSGTNTPESSFDANVVMVLSVLLCALICALGLNSIIRCALRCSNRVTYNSGDNTAIRLANTGVKKKALKTFPIVTYLTGLKLPGLDTECVICLSEFAPGERIRVLPKCNHGFHIRCIDKWLISHSSCPTCRHCLIETCQKIVGCSQPSSSELPPPPPPPLQGSIVPLEPEGFIRNLRGNC
ncbi:zinc finger protein [Macleaya cordata]|uniref:Zinc finger protein n=1 Tax=Macleaya cordata TaxID=56857 RepID=A0A200R0P6_MACCD|nr:zinc finger protein [Macleaya cordata]